ncbi:hypothetical protein SAMN05720470_10498 [Fibrobacter sp. UWOV1]|uniref:hypothetical protein n=1 Tax=Fibrobacter sp. UWOV1 TaxID=1896215 RepID=UPI000913CB9C|nr:hypothetical protein [Fibrobacter sp. UWOV1]SHL03912.1 hypothetical protein SAMN05720470_10498 [Fibrobacter sp. UWOV1]
MINLLKTISKTALFKASFFAALFCLAACNLGPDPDADGARFNRRFHYYYVQDCRFDSFGAYDCGPIHSLSPSMTVGLRIDSDGLASLNLDGDRYYYLESEYTEDYDSDYGPFFGFTQNDDDLTIYKSGEVMAYWDNANGLVTYYFYEIYD